MSTYTPLVTVVVPMYNVAKYIGAAITSVLNQTYRNFELLLIDDGSPDNSVPLALQFDDPRIKIISQQNRGLAGARNTGLNAARGKYIALLDADDLWSEQKLAEHVKHLEQTPDVDISYCPSVFMDEDGKVLDCGQYPKLTSISQQHILCRNPVGNGSAAVIRHSLIDKIKAEQFGASRFEFFDERLRQSEDIEFWVRCALNYDAKFEGIKPALTYYRLNQDGLSANLEKQLASWYVAMIDNQTRHPEFFARYFSLAEAYQFRYLARRAIHSQMPEQAWFFAKRALSAAPSILLREPTRTASTFFCALLLRFFNAPMSWFLKRVFA